MMDGINTKLNEASAIIANKLLQDELAKLREELAECAESNKDVERALEGFSYSGSYGDGVRKMREELEHVKNLLTCESIKAERAENRAERAEAKIREADGQAPVALLKEEWLHYEQASATVQGAFPVYYRPIPPADVAELERHVVDKSRHIGEMQRRIAELERKLRLCRKS